MPKKRPAEPEPPQAVLEPFDPLMGGTISNETEMQDHANAFHAFLEKEHSTTVVDSLIEELERRLNVGLSTKDALALVKKSLGFPFYNQGIVNLSRKECQNVTNLVLMCPSRLNYGLNNSCPTAQLLRPFVEAAESQSSGKFCFMEVLWYCKQLKSTSSTCDGGLDSKTTWNVALLTKLYKVQVILFQIAGINIQRTVSFGSLARQVVPGADLHCVHPAYFLRKLPKDLFHLISLSPAQNQTCCSSMSDRKSTQNNLSSKAYLMDLLNTCVKSYVKALCVGFEQTAFSFVKSHSSYHHLCCFAASWDDISECEESHDLKDVIKPKFPKSADVQSTVMNVGRSLDSFIIHRPNLRKGRKKVNPKTPIEKLSFPFDTFRADHFKFFIKVKLWICFLGWIGSRLRKSISTLQKGVLGQVTDHIKGILNHPDWKVGSMLVQLPRKRPTDTFHTKKLVEVLIFYRVHNNLFEVQFLWRKTSNLGCFQPKNPIKAAVLEYGLSLGAFLIDGETNFLGFSPNAAFSTFLERNHASIPYIGEIDDQSQERLNPLSMSVPAADVNWTTRYYDPLDIFPFKPTSIYVKSTFDSMKLFRYQKVCTLSSFSKLGLDEKSIRKLDSINVPTKWKAKLLVSDVVFDVQEGILRSSSLKMVVPYLNICICSLPQTVFKVILKQNAFTFSRVFNFVKSTPTGM